MCVYSLEGVALAGVEFWGGPHPFTLKALALTKYWTPCIFGDASRYRRASSLSSRERGALINNSSAGRWEVFSYREKKKQAGGAEEEGGRLAGDQYDLR